MSNVDLIDLRPISVTDSDQRIKRKVREVKKEGVEQAKMWLRTGDPQAVNAAALVLVSTQVRVATLEGKSAEVVLS